MFNEDFYPTPTEIIEQMLEGFTIENKVVLEPSAGKGNIVDWLLINGAKEVVACEKHPDLQRIVSGKCRILASDFMTVKGEDISHVDMIVMNPPFTADEKHISHAWAICPAGCTILALCNLSTIENIYSQARERLVHTIKEFGRYTNLGECFGTAERKTNVKIALVVLQKPGKAGDSEFDGFFTDEEPQDEGSNGIMPYNVIRDLVQRYTEMVKLFDKQLELGVQMNQLTRGFYFSKLSFHCTEDGKTKTRNDFKKDLQKSGWTFIFDKLNMQKYATRGLKEDINSFIEKQTNVPFTMKNIYRMLEIIIGTQGSRMDKALEEVFDKLTQHYDENRYAVEGWKTNSHYLINQKFIIPHIVECGWNYKERGMQLTYYSNGELVEDMQKALCYITGTNYDSCTTLYKFLQEQKVPAGEWRSWGFFEIKCYKKGTMHFKFNSIVLWGKFNQRIAKIKGYPLYESVKNYQQASV